MIAWDLENLPWMAVMWRGVLPSLLCSETKTYHNVGHYYGFLAIEYIPQTTGSKNLQEVSQVLVQLQQHK